MEYKFEVRGDKIYWPPRTIPGRPAGFTVTLQEVVSQVREKSTWHIILAPGRIWSEPGDSGYSRASLPFTLIPSKAFYSQTHNGIATFLFDDKNVSALRFQIVQEAAPDAKFDAWGQADMRYLPSALPGQIALTQRFINELANKTPIRSWTELEQICDPKALDKIDDTENRDNIALKGFIGPKQQAKN